MRREAAVARPLPAAVLAREAPPLPAAPGARRVPEAGVAGERRP
jgi:hypothetical protein